jgi:ABC-type Zn uptake system ZnuABC Zn-binding protein ZnuA
VIYELIIGSDKCCIASKGDNSLDFNYCSSRANLESIKRVILNKLKTNTSFYPLYDFDSHVGRDRINVSMMILSRGGI